MGERIGKGMAIGKIILIGEHSVVYGQPALAMPFTRIGIDTTICKKDGLGELDCVLYKGSLNQAGNDLSGLSTIIRGIAGKFNDDIEDLNIKINSSIPIGRGMGSSAAVAVATTRALYDYFGHLLTKDELYEWISISEKLVHGNPSGIDASVIIAEEAIYYKKGKPTISYPIDLEAHLIAADTGEIGKTQEAVNYVREFIESNPKEGEYIIKELGELAENAKDAMDNRHVEEFGSIMNESHTLLDGLGVSNGRLNNLVHIARNNGALGAKLTGGGRGGCIIALAYTIEQSQYISRRLLESGAKDTWIQFLGVEDYGE